MIFKPHQSQASIRQQASRKHPLSDSLNISKVLIVVSVIFVSAYFLEVIVSSYFASPPEYSQEFQETYQKIGEKNKRSY